MDKVKKHFNTSSNKFIKIFSLIEDFVADQPLILVVIEFTILCVVSGVGLNKLSLEILNRLKIDTPFLFSNTNTYTDISFFVKFITTAILVPFRETIIHQWFPKHFLDKYKFSNFHIVLFSSIFFSLMHFPNYIFVLSAFFLGLIFQFVWNAKFKKAISQAFLNIYLIHALYNFVMISITKYLY
jgi:CAAX protease family protein